MASAVAIPGPSTSSDNTDSEIQEAAPDAKILSPKQEVFAKHHTENSPTKLTYEKSLKTQYHHFSCWRTTKEEKIVLGGIEGLTVLSADGMEAVYRFPKDTDMVSSGLALTNEKHLVCTYKKHVFTVNIADDTPPGTQLHHVNRLDVKDPICVFVRNKLEYGVLCLDPSRVEFFSLKNILMDRSPTNSGSIHLDMPNPFVYDVACFTKDDIISVTSYIDRVVYMYNTNGHILQIIGEQREKKASVRAGLMYKPVSIQCCGDVIIVSCRQGDVHAYESGTWRLLMNKGNTDSGKLSSLFTVRKIRYTVLSENRLWAIQGPTDKNMGKNKFEDFQIVHLYTF